MTSELPHPLGPNVRAPRLDRDAARAAELLNGGEGAGNWFVVVLDHDLIGPVVGPQVVRRPGGGGVAGMVSVNDPVTGRIARRRRLVNAAAVSGEGNHRPAVPGGVELTTCQSPGLFAYVVCVSPATAPHSSWSTYGSEVVPVTPAYPGNGQESCGPVSTHAQPAPVPVTVGVGVGVGAGDGLALTAACPAHCTGVADAAQEGVRVTHARS
jgi:hypothetical protein